MEEKTSFEKMCLEIVNMILSLPIETQTEAFERVRTLLIAERKAYIEKERAGITNHIQSTDLAQKLMEGVYMAEYRPNPEEKIGERRY